MGIIWNDDISWYLTWVNYGLMMQSIMGNIYLNLDGSSCRTCCVYSWSAVWRRIPTCGIPGHSQVFTNCCPPWSPKSDTSSIKSEDNLPIFFGDSQMLKADILLVKLPRCPIYAIDFQVSSSPQTTRGDWCWCLPRWMQVSESLGSMGWRFVWSSKMAR